MAQAENKIVFSEQGLDQIEQRLQDVERRSGSLLSKLPKDLQKEWTKAIDATALAARYAVTGAANSFISAVSAPAKSTFEGVLADANRIRKDSSLIAVATGKQFEQVRGTIQLTAKATLESTAKVDAFTRGVRRLGGDFDAATSSMEAYKDRALQMDKPIELFQEQAALLDTAFGVRGKQRVNEFFGVLDAQAGKAGVSAQKLDRQFFAFVDNFSRLSSKGPAAFGALSAAFAASDANPEQSRRNQAFGMGLLNTGVRQIEQRMRLGGALGKGEMLTDVKTGEVDEKKYLRAMQFLQKDLVKYYGSRRRAIEVQAGDDLEARRDIAGFLNTDLSKVQDMSQLSPQQRQTLERYSGMPAGRRDLADVNKEIKDQNAGAGMLGAQDTAVELGGGAAGLALTAAAGVFSTAVDRFGGIVASMAGRTGGGLLTGAAAGLGSAAGGLLRGGASALRAGAGLLGGAAGGALALTGAAYAGWQAGSYADQQLGLSDKISSALAKWTIPGYEEGQEMPAGGFPRGAPQPMSQQDARALAQANADALANRTITVRLAPEAPPGQPAPR